MNNSFFSNASKSACKIFLLLTVLLTQAKPFIASANASEEVDRKNLPIAPRAFTNPINKTLEGSDPLWPHTVKAPEGAPNVVLILVDDAGFGNPSAFGGMTSTPNLERVASQGIKFNRFHVTALCSPSRAALISGRNQHAIGFGSVAEFAGGWPGYNASWPKSAASIGKILRLNGYATACFGKWHLTPADSFGPAGPFDLWPNNLGFTYFWGFLGGETDQFSPLLFENNTIIGAPKEKNFYLNHALADHTINWITQQKSVAPQQPFFIYFSTGSSHAPHQVPKEWADKYKGKFDLGWDKYREQVFKQQKELGVVPADAQLTARDPAIPEWDSLSLEQKQLYARQMEVYSGYQENTDHEIGRVLDHINKLGIADNTVIIWVWGDNGASLEGTETGSFNEMTTLNGIPLSPAQQLELIKNYGGLDAWGGPTTEPHYSCAWAWAGNTPFQWGKQVASHLGGTRDPMVISWPKGIQDKGGTRSQFTHLIDVAPTILELAKIPQPETVEGVKQMPMHGTSFAYTFADAKAKERHTQQYFEVFGNRAMYKDGWWLSARVQRKPWKIDPETLSKLAPGKWDPDKDPVELYDLNTDFSQSKNLAEKYPDKVNELKTLFWDEARKFQVLPLLAGMSVYMGPKFTPPRSALTHFEYLAGTENIPPTVCPQIFNRSYTVSADLNIPNSGAEGVIMANADYLGGYALYVEDKKARFTYSFMGIKNSTIVSSDDLPSGKVTLKYEFISDKPGAMGAGGTQKLYLNGKQVAEGRIEQTMAVLTTAYAGFDIGKDNGLPVSRSYESKLPFAFTGTVEKVTVDLGAM